MDALITLRIPLDDVGPHGPLNHMREAEKIAEGLADSAEALIERVEVVEDVMAK